jgi:hypothetical protein
MSVDRMFTSPMFFSWPHKLIRSMEIKLDVGYIDTAKADKNGVPLDSIMSAYFQMVARDMNNKPAEGM